MLVLDAPEGYAALLDPLPEGAVLDASAPVPGGTGAYDVVQLFARTRDDLACPAEAALAALRPGGVLWLSYPKKSSKVQTDLSRDAGWDVLNRLGLGPVAAISIDDVWSGLRFGARPDLAP